MDPGKKLTVMTEKNGWMEDRVEEGEIERYRTSHKNVHISGCYKYIL